MRVVFYVPFSWNANTEWNRLYIVYLFIVGAENIQSFETPRDLLETCFFFLLLPVSLPVAKYLLI